MRSARLVLCIAAGVAVLVGSSGGASAEQTGEFQFSPEAGQRGQIVSVRGSNCRVGAAPADEAFVYLSMRAGQRGAPFFTHSSYDVRLDATWSGEFVIAKDAPSGTYKLAVDCVEDDASVEKGYGPFEVRPGEAPVLSAAPATVVAGAPLVARITGCRTADGVLEKARLSIVPAAGGAAVAEGTAPVDGGAAAERTLVVPTSARGPHRLEGRCSTGATALAADGRPVEITAPPPPAAPSTTRPRPTTSIATTASTSAPVNSTTTTTSELALAQSPGRNPSPKSPNGMGRFLLPTLAVLLLAAVGTGVALVRRKT